MQLEKVIVTVVATHKHDGLKGYKMMIIQPLTDSLQPSGKPVVAIDSVQAGANDLVHWVSAREATLVMENSFAPVDAAITGIVDDVYVVGGGIKNKEEIFT